MTLAWLNGQEAAEIGAALANEFALTSSASGSMEHLLRRADSEVRPLRLNFYKKAKFANSFKWRLIEKGVARGTADEVTQSLVLHLSQNPEPASTMSAVAPAGRSDQRTAKDLFRRGNKFFEQRAFAEAAALYEQVLEMDSRHAEVLNNLGSSFSYLGRIVE